MAIQIRKSPAIKGSGSLPEPVPSFRGDIHQQDGPPPVAVKQSRDKLRTVSERLAIVNDLGDNIDVKATEDFASRHNIKVKTLKSWLKDAELFRFLESEGMGELTRVSRKYQGNFKQGSTCVKTSMDLQDHVRPEENSSTEFAGKSPVLSNEARAVPPSSGSFWVDDTPEINPTKDTEPDKGEAGSAPEWYYIDLQHAIQGPFDRRLMRGWWEEGYLKKELSISPISDGPFVSLEAVFPEGDAFGDS